jgi:hypothetical protein
MGIGSMMPAPERLTGGVLNMFSGMTRALVLEPVAEGMKVTSTTQLAPGGKGGPSVLSSGAQFVAR